MYVIKKTFRKTNDSVAFYEDQKFNIYQEKMYRKKMAHEHQVFDGSTLRHIQVWPTEEDYRRWTDDPTVIKHLDALDAYNAQNKIDLNEISAVV
jgi:hypothetical protein